MTDTEWANAVEKNHTDRHARCKVAADHQFVKNAISAKLNKAKFNKPVPQMRYLGCENY